MRAWRLIGTRLRAAVIDQPKVAKLCITPLGMPVVPEVYMMVASSLPSRTGLPASGGVAATMLSHVVYGLGGDSGVLMQGSSAGMPGFIVSQPSSLPTNSSFDSLCTRIWRIVSAASVGYSGTDTWPAIQIAKSHISQCAQFFDRIAMREPGSKPRPLRCAAMRRVSSITWAQV
jgi:hypothetical protein